MSIADFVSSEDRLAYTISAAVTATGIGRSTLYKAHAAGLLKMTRIGQRTLILKKDLEDFLRGGAESLDAKSPVEIDMSESRRKMTEHARAARMAAINAKRAAKLAEV